MESDPNEMNRQVEMQTSNDREWNMELMMMMIANVAFLVPFYRGVLLCEDEKCNRPRRRAGLV
jgi:hypothetical protein